MSTVTSKLSINYKTASGDSRTLTYKGVRTSLNSSIVTTICSSLLTNAVIFKYPPSSITSAKLTVSSEDEIAIDL